MDRYVEQKRERRRRDFARTVERAVTRAGLRLDRPGFHFNGQRVETWDDLFRVRRLQGRRLAENLRRSRGKRYGGSNPRRLTGDPKVSDLRKAQAAADQLLEAGSSGGHHWRHQARHGRLR